MTSSHLTWVKTQRPLLSCSSPPAPTVGMLQLTSVGKREHIGFLRPPAILTRSLHISRTVKLFYDEHLFVHT